MSSDVGREAASGDASNIEWCDLHYQTAEEVVSLVDRGVAHRASAAPRGAMPQRLPTAWEIRIGVRVKPHDRKAPGFPPRANFHTSLTATGHVPSGSDRPMRLDD